MLPRMATGWANARDAPTEELYIYWSGFHRGASEYANIAYSNMTLRAHQHRSTYREWTTRRWPDTGAYILAHYMAFRRTLHEAPRLDPIHIPLAHYLGVFTMVHTGLYHLARDEEQFTRALKDRDVALRAASHMIGGCIADADAAQEVWAEDEAVEQPSFMAIPATSWTESTMNASLDIDGLQDALDVISGNADRDDADLIMVGDPREQDNTSIYERDEDEAVYPPRRWVNTWQRVAGRWQRTVLDSDTPDDGGPTTDADGMRLWPDLSLANTLPDPPSSAIVNYIVDPTTGRETNRVQYRVVTEPDGHRHWELIENPAPNEGMNAEGRIWWGGPLDPDA